MAKFNKKNIIDLVHTMNLETYNVTDDYFCIKGINGHVSVINYDKDPISGIKNHLIQMGRDSLKLELNDLLSITKHKLIRESTNK